MGYLNGCFRKWWYPQIIHFNRVFHYKPSILGYHYFWKHPNVKKSKVWSFPHLGIGRFFWRDCGVGGCVPPASGLHFRSWVNDRRENPTRSLICHSPTTWRIIPGLVSGYNSNLSFRPFGRGITLLMGLILTMVINHLLTGMILQELTKIVKSSSIIASCDIFLDLILWTCQLTRGRRSWRFPWMAQNPPAKRWSMHPAVMLHQPKPWGRERH